jgi:hypothetical protein
MMASTLSIAARRRIPASLRSHAQRAQSTQVQKSRGAIGEDGRHEVVDQDSEPK